MWKMRNWLPNLEYIPIIWIVNTKKRGLFKKGRKEEKWNEHQRNSVWFVIYSQGRLDCWPETLWWVVLPKEIIFVLGGNAENCRIWAWKGVQWTRTGSRGHDWLHWEGGEGASSSFHFSQHLNLRVDFSGLVVESSPFFLFCAICFSCSSRLG